MKPMPKSYKTKIFYDIFSLVDEIDKFRGERTIVTVNGCFDVLTGGHIHILAEAAKLKGNGVLVVGINSDKSVKKLKGKPILNHKERAKTIALFPFVDYVTIFHEKKSLRFVELIMPDIHVNDASYGLNCVERPALDDMGAKLHLVPRLNLPSSSEIKRRIRKSS